MYFMKKSLLLAIFVLLNFIAIFGAYILWNTSSMAAGAGWILVWVTGGVGTFLGGFLASQNLYQRPLSHWIFAVAAVAIFFGISAWVGQIDYPIKENGPFPTHPWHENGFVWLYLIVSTLWMFIQATRSK